MGAGEGKKRWDFEGSSFLRSYTVVMGFLDEVAAFFFLTSRLASEGREGILPSLILPSGVSLCPRLQYYAMFVVTLYV